MNNLCQHRLIKLNEFSTCINQLFKLFTQDRNDIISFTIKTP